MKKFYFWAIVVLVIIGVLFAIRGASCAGTLIKGESYNSVYYLAQDGKRYVFPNDKTFLSWYENFDTVQIITDAALGNISIGGNVTYRPGSRLVKITTDPKTYAVDKSGTLRWITSENVALSIYGLDWAKNVDDIPDEFFTNYKVGSPINKASEFNSVIETTIDAEKGLGGGVDVPAEITIPLIQQPVEEPIKEPEIVIEPEIIAYKPQNLHFDKITMVSGSWNKSRRLLNIDVFNGAMDGIYGINYSIDEVRGDGSIFSKKMEITRNIEVGSNGMFVVHPTYEDSIFFMVYDIEVMGWNTGTRYNTNIEIKFSI